MINPGVILTLAMLKENFKNDTYYVTSFAVAGFSTSHAPLLEEPIADSLPSQCIHQLCRLTPICDTQEVLSSV